MADKTYIIRSFNDEILYEFDNIDDCRDFFLNKFNVDILKVKIRDRELTTEFIHRTIFMEEHKFFEYGDLLILRFDKAVENIDIVQLDKGRMEQIIRDKRIDEILKLLEN